MSVRSSLPVGAVVVLALGALDFGLEQSLVVPALPALAEHYDASLTAAAWLVTGFLLSGIVAVPVLGRLGDLYGKRRILFASLESFVIGSLICALTHSIALAIAGRLIQGLGAAIGPLVYGLARDTLPPHLLSRAVGTVVGAATAGGAIGFALSGVLVDRWGPASIFWFLFAFSSLLVVALAVFVRESPVRAKASVDVGGAVLLGSGLFSLVLAVSQGNTWGWSSERVVGLFAAALVLLTGFVVVERRVAQPLVDLKFVTRRPFVNANLCAVAFGYAFFIAVLTIPLIAATPTDSGYGQGLSTTEIGLLLLPTGAASAFAGWTSGRLVDRVGSRTLVAAGSALAVAAYLALAIAHDSFAELAVGSAVIGLSWGLLLTGITPVVIRNADSDKTGVAVAVMVAFRNTAAAVGAQVAIAIIVGAGLVDEFRAESGYTKAFVMGATGAAVALVMSFFMPGPAVRRPPAI